MGRKIVLLWEASWAISMALFCAWGSFSCAGGGGGGGSGGGPVTLLACSLGCGGTTGCTVSQVAPNQPITLYFSQPIDPASVNAETFQVFRVPQGTTAAGSYVAKSDGSVSFYPNVGFEEQTGLPEFGLAQNAQYKVIVPASGDALFTMKSLGGKPIAQGIDCFVSATGSPVDSVPGSPSVSFLTPGPVANADPASIVELEFNDIMNLSSLFDPVSQKSASVLVEASVDADGNPATPDEKIAVPGVFAAYFPSFTSTRLVFTPSISLGGGSPKTIRVSVLSSVKDLVGNALLNPSVFQFAVKALPQASLESAVAEEFANSGKEDFARTGALWNRNNSGKLEPGSPVGPGLLEDLRVKASQTIVLDTDAICADFPETKPNETPSGYGAPDPACALSIPINNDGQEISLFSALFPGASLSSVTLQNGVLSLGSLRVESGGVLEAKGSKPLRLLVRGRTEIQGLVRLDGKDGEDQLAEVTPDTELGGLGGFGGPGAGRGGNGGDDPAVLNGNPQGQSGQGRGATAAGTNGGGGGSPSFPLNAQSASLTWAAGCLASEAASGPGGGGFLASGAGGAIASKGATKGPTGPGGSSFVGNPFADPFGSNFTGGAGGGGGGATPWASATVQNFICSPTALQFPPFGCGNFNPNNCPTPNQTGCLNPCFLINFVPSCCKLDPVTGVPAYRWDAGGGGGGGAGSMLLQTGRDLLVTGFLSAEGGDGGDGLLDPPTFPGNPPVPKGGVGGGGGSGGLLHLRAAQGIKVELGAALSAKAGIGGLGSANGGAGANGAVKIEVDLGLTKLPGANELGGLIEPAPSISGMSATADCPTILGIGLPPGGVCLYGMSAAQSQFYALKAKFLDPQLLRCELDLDLASGPVSLSLPADGAAPLGTGGWIADPIGHATPGGILFQGAEDDGNGNPKEGSLTPWVSDIRLLNGGNPAVTKRKNLVRFLFLFDGAYSGPDAALALRALRFVVKGI